MEITKIVQLQREFFNSHQTFEVTYRLIILKKLKELLLKYEPKFALAFKKDYNKGEFDFLSTEFMLVMDELNYMIKHIDKLTKIKKVKTSLINFPSKGRIYPEPYGVVLIMAPWNYPLQLTLSPLMGALAAGNCVVLKPASYTKNVSKVIYDMINELEHPEIVSVVLGGRDENQALLDQRFDYIFFTGGDSVGRLVLEKASKYLTPVSLELGGKSPCIVLQDADIDLAAKRITWGKFLNAGQTCVAPDYVCVHKDIHKKFVQRVIYYIKKYYYDENNKLSDDFVYLINEKHLNKILSLIDESKLVFGGNHDGLKFEPTVLDNVTFNDKIMQEEIFGPLMPIIVFDNIYDLIMTLNNMEKPLAFYLFSQNKKFAKTVFNIMSYGGGCFNDVIMHLTNENLPFGGVGKSGMGSYHGKKSFETFTHYKSVLLKGKKELNIKYPPYNSSKISILKKLIGLK